MANIVSCVKNVVTCCFVGFYRLMFCSYSHLTVDVKRGFSFLLSNSLRILKIPIDNLVFGFRNTKAENKHSNSYFQFQSNGVMLSWNLVSMHDRPIIYNKNQEPNPTSNVLLTLNSKKRLILMYALHFI